MSFSFGVFLSNCMLLTCVCVCMCTFFFTKTKSVLKVELNPLTITVILDIKFIPDIILFFKFFMHSCYLSFIALIPVLFIQFKKICWIHIYVFSSLDILYTLSIFIMSFFPTFLKELYIHLSIYSLLQTLVHQVHQGRYIPQGMIIFPSQLWESLLF